MTAQRPAGLFEELTALRQAQAKHPKQVGFYNRILEEQAVSRHMDSLQRQLETGNVPASRFDSLERVLVAPHSKTSLRKPTGKFTVPEFEIHHPELVRRLGRFIQNPKLPSRLRTRLTNLLVRYHRAYGQHLAPDRLHELAVPLNAVGHPLGGRLLREYRSPTPPDLYANLVEGAASLAFEDHVANVFIALCTRTAGQRNRLHSWPRIVDYYLDKLRHPAPIHHPEIWLNLVAQSLSSYGVEQVPPVRREYPFALKVNDPVRPEKLVGALRQAGFSTHSGSYRGDQLVHAVAQRDLRNYFTPWRIRQLRSKLIARKPNEFD